MQVTQVHTLLFDAYHHLRKQFLLRAAKSLSRIMGYY